MPGCGGSPVSAATSLEQLFHAARHSIITWHEIASHANLVAHINGRIILRVIEHASGWRWYHCGDAHDRSDYDSEDAARAAAETASAVAVAPVPPHRTHVRSLRHAS